MTLVLRVFVDRRERLHRAVSEFDPELRKMVGDLVHTCTLYNRKCTIVAEKDGVAKIIANR